VNKLRLRIAAVLCASAAVWFVVTAVVTKDVGRAWDTLAGLRTPWGDYAWATLPLSMLGYLLIPVAIFTAIAIGIDTAVGRQLVPLDEAIDKVRERLQGAKS
jgi:di/tricarboxylate transporter